MTRTFKETPIFTKKWMELGLNDNDLIKLQQVLLNDPKSGKVIKDTGGLRKIRIPIESIGKRGGCRVIYVDLELKETIYFINVYEKNQQENLTEAEKKAFKNLLKILKEE